LLKEARLWVAEEQGCKAPTLIDEDDLVEQLPPSSPRLKVKANTVPIQASWYDETANAFKEVWKQGGAYRLCQAERPHLPFGILCQMAATAIVAASLSHCLIH
jgi:hypothetical protein